MTEFRQRCLHDRVLAAGAPAMLLALPLWRTKQGLFSITNCSFLEALLHAEEPLAL